MAFNRRKPIGNLIAHFIKAIYMHDFCLYMDNKPLAGGRLSCQIFAEWINGRDGAMGGCGGFPKPAE